LLLLLLMLVEPDEEDDPEPVRVVYGVNENEGQKFNSLDKFTVEGR
jgi:hypothetical protein